MIAIDVICPVLHPAGSWEWSWRRIGRRCDLEVARRDVKTAIRVDGSIDDERRARLNLEIVHKKDRVGPRQVEFLFEDAANLGGNVTIQRRNLDICGCEVVEAIWIVDAPR